jgi:hypothetical protein
MFWLPLIALLGVTAISRSADFSEMIGLLEEIAYEPFGHVVGETNITDTEITVSFSIDLDVKEGKLGLIPVVVFPNIGTNLICNNHWERSENNVEALFTFDLELTNTDETEIEQMIKRTDNFKIIDPKRINQYSIPINTDFYSVLGLMTMLDKQSYIELRLITPDLVVFNEPISTISLQQLLKIFNPV